MLIRSLLDPCAPRRLRLSDMACGTGAVAFPNAVRSLIRFKTCASALSTNTISRLALQDVSGTFSRGCEPMARSMRHRYTHGMTEGFNTTIKLIQRQAFGL